MTKPAQMSLAVFTEHFRAAITPSVQRMGEQLTAMYTSLRPFIEYAAQHPELFLESGSRLELGSCHCLCGGHPDYAGVCIGQAERGLTMRFDSATVGSRDVPMCRPCHNARSGVRQADPTISVEVDHITDTCTCHCWQNHPGQAGVCEGGSDPGYEINSEAACASCRVAARKA